MFDNDEDDFQPLIKRKKNKENADASAQSMKKNAVKKKSQVKPAGKETETKQKSASKVKRKTPKKKTPVKERKKYDGFCPRCQMPYSLFVIETPTWHDAECVESYHPESECPDGADCDCTIQSHYCKYSHIQLAKKRQLLNDTEQRKKSKQRLTYGRQDKTATILVEDSDEQSDHNHSVVNATDIPDSITETHKNETLSPDIIPLTHENEMLSKEDISSLSKYNNKQNLENNVTEEVVDDSSVDLPCASRLKQPMESPVDLCNNVDSAFKEAMLCCGQNDNESSELQCSVESEQDLVESFLNDESSRSRSLYDDQSCRSVSDIDASEDSDVKQSIHKSDVNTRNTLGNSGMSSFSQTCKVCGDMYKFRHVCDIELKHSVNSDCSQESDIRNENNQCKFHSDNVLPRLEEVEVKTDTDDDSNSRSFFANYRMKRESQTGSKCQVCQSPVSGEGHLVKNSDFVKYSYKTSANEKDGTCMPIDNSLLSGGRNDLKFVRICNSCEEKFEESKQIKHCTPDDDGDLDSKDCWHKDNDSQSSICAEVFSESSKISSSQSSQKSNSTTNSSIKKSSAKKEVQRRNGKVKTSLVKEDSKQTSLFSFFSGGKKLSEGKMTDVKENSNDCLADSYKRHTSGGTNPNKLTKIKSVNDVLMCSMKKSSPESMTEDQSALKPPLVKSATDVLINSNQISRPVNGRGKSKEEGDCSSTSEGKKPVRSCPFYKKIPDTGFTVDAFCYGEVPGCKGYFLSHFHYDHYRGLTKKFNHPIYCSQITGNLIKSRMNIKPDIVHCLPMNVPCKVEDTEVTLLDANHCPGSVLFLFKTKSGKTILHTGDFRANQSMEVVPCLQNIYMHQLYLDTTYCDPKYAFPPQNQVIEFGVTLVEKFLAEKPNCLIVCGSYTIGKERIFTAIARRFDMKISVLRDKYKVLECLEDEDLSKRLTLNFNESSLHVLPMGKLNVQDLHKHRESLERKYENVIAIEPTGWTYNDKLVSLDQIKPKGSKDIKIYGLPYSEHSSYLELKRFVQYFRPRQILPTVNNGNPTSRKKMENLFHSWLTETDAEKKPKQTDLGNWTK